nr:myosin-7-like [Zootoca vivipara]
MTSLMMTRDNDPKYFLQVENGPGNVFVTQLGEHRCSAGGDSFEKAWVDLKNYLQLLHVGVSLAVCNMSWVCQIMLYRRLYNTVDSFSTDFSLCANPDFLEDNSHQWTELQFNTSGWHQSISDILQHRRKALQKFRLRKKEIENEQASAELTAKKQEFKERMEALAQRREALEQKDQDSISDILQHRRKALQKFRLRKKEIENEQASAELTAKKQEFKERMEALAQRREALEQKDQDRKNRILEFDAYIQECRQKKERVIQLFHEEHRLKALKKREVFKLKKELKKLQVRKKKLQKKMAKYKSLQDFLKEVTATIRPDFLGYPEDSVVEALIKRHKTLFEENQSLRKNLSTQQCHIEETQKELESLREEHNITTFMLLGKISELQSKKSSLQEKKIHLCHYIDNEECLIDQQRQDLSRMLLAVNNMAELCYMPHYGPLDDMTLLSKLDMIQESIMRKKQIVEETKALQSDELTRSSSHLLREKSSSTFSRERSSSTFSRERSYSTLLREQLKKQISFASLDKLEDKGGKA